MASGESIAEKIKDVLASRAAIITAIEVRGVTVQGDEKVADLAGLVSQIKTYQSGAADTCSIDRDTATSIVIPDGVTRIGTRAFYECLEMKSLTIPSSVKSIGNEAFARCSALEGLTIPDGVEEIGEASFGRRNMQYLSIPSSVKRIGRAGIAGSPSCNISFAKTKEEVANMENYPWSITSGSTIHCTDGDLTVAG